MATSSSYYLNAPSLGSATAVFTDIDLSICAPDGFYSNGVIVREQVGCILLPQQNCPSCQSFNCVEGVCSDPGDGSGTYATLLECQLACNPDCFLIAGEFTTLPDCVLVEGEFIRLT